MRARGKQASSGCRCQRRGRGRRYRRAGWPFCDGGEFARIRTDRRRTRRRLPIRSRSAIPTTNGRETGNPEANRLLRPMPGLRLTAAREPVPARVATAECDWNFPWLNLLSIPAVDGHTGGRIYDCFDGAVPRGFHAAGGDEEDVFRHQRRVGRLSGQQQLEIYGNFGPIGGAGNDPQDFRPVRGCGFHYSLGESDDLKGGKRIALSDRETAGHRDGSDNVNHFRLGHEDGVARANRDIFFGCLHDCLYADRRDTVEAAGTDGGAMYRDRAPLEVAGDLYGGSGIRPQPSGEREDIE